MCLITGVGGEELLGTGGGVETLFGGKDFSDLESVFSFPV